VDPRAGLDVVEKTAVEKSELLTLESNDMTCSINTFMIYRVESMEYIKLKTGMDLNQFQYVNRIS
jgi:hypothetical protein